jgi:hypothetical protein
MKTHTGLLCTYATSSNVRYTISFLTGIIGGEMQSMFQELSH